MNETRKNSALIINLLAILLFIFSWLSVNIYLPALPFLASHFDTTQKVLNASLTAFLLGFSLSQLFWGPISEKYGRRPLLIIGLLCSGVGIVITMTATNVWIFNGGRLLEAAGLGVAPALARAILSDSLESTALVVTMTFATIASNLMPAIAPIIGGHLLVWFGWRYIFVFLFAYNLLTLYLLLVHFRESIPAINSKLKFFATFKEYGVVLRNKKFIGYLTPYFLATGGMIAYYTATPFIFIIALHLAPKDYGFYSLISVATYIIGALSNRFLLGKNKLNTNILIGISMLALSFVLLLVCAIFYHLTIFSVILPMSVYTFGAGLISPNSNAGAIEASRSTAGVGASLIGVSVYFASAVLSTIITSLDVTSLWPLTWYIGGISFIALAGFYRLVYRAPLSER
jgi:Bcr/CflA subfamily drug resistance transporter